MNKLGKNEAGFTLLETVVALLVTTLCFLLLSFSSRHFSRNKQMIQQEKQIEFHLFLYQLEAELRGKEWVSTKETELKMRNPETGQEITYEKNLQLFRRRVSNTGHQPMLTGIRTLKLTTEKNILYLSVEFTNGERHEAQLDLSYTLPKNPAE